MLKSIRAAKQLSDFVIVTIHAHEPGNWSQEPADFLPKLARAAIDAGADQFIGHGPHQVRGIEVYRGKPIFYSLGDFIFQLDLLEPVGSDLFEQYKMDAGTTTDAEFNAMWNRLVFGGEVWYQSVVTTSRFEKGQIARSGCIQSIWATRRAAPIAVSRAWRHRRSATRSSSGCSACRSRSEPGSRSRAGSGSSGWPRNPRLRRSKNSEFLSS